MGNVDSVQTQDFQAPQNYSCIFEGFEIFIVEDEQRSTTWISISLPARGTWIQTD